MTIDNFTKDQLAFIEKIINDRIDVLIPKREACKLVDKYTYRYIIKKLEAALSAIHKAQDKIKEMEK